jgi:hypothetical protein
MRATSEAHSALNGGNMVWTGRIMSAIAVIFMLMDATIHVLKPPPVVQAFAQLGYPIALSAGLGVLEFLCVVIYVIPRTAVFGALLLTGYLGGATATQLRVGSPIFELIFPALIGILVWGGIYLREERLRQLIPLR